MGCRICKCGRPKDCNDDLCIMCELIEDAKDKVKKVFGGNHDKSIGQRPGEENPEDCAK